MLHREGEYRGRQHARQQPGLEPGGGEDRRGVAGEVGRAVAGVVADDHRTPGAALLAEPGGESGGGAAHHGRVHAVGPGPQRPPQPGGAEGERTGEAVAEFGGVAGVEQGLQLGGGGGVDLVGNPVGDAPGQLPGDAHVLPSAAARISSMPNAGPVNRPPTQASVGRGSGSASRSAKASASSCGR